jgi:hypothetical protein
MPSNNNDFVARGGNLAVQVHEIARVTDHVGLESRLAGSVRNFDGISVSSIPDLVAGLARIGDFNHLPVRLRVTESRREPASVSLGNVAAQVKFPVLRATGEDYTTRVLRGEATAQETVELISSKFLGAQIGERWRFDRASLPTSPQQEKKDEIRRLFCAACWEIRDILDPLNARMGALKAELEQKSFGLGGQAGLQEFKDGKGSEAESYSQQREVAFSRALLEIKIKVDDLNFALKALHRN